MAEVHVAVGVILRGHQVYVCLRPDDKHQGGKWEFPGGKVDGDETVEQALQRELDEEVGIRVIQTSPLTVITHDYGDKKVVLDVHTVTTFTGEPFGKEGQEGQWRDINALSPEDFPAANVEIIDALRQTRKL
ncbi:8-oxo-dGTP diphosphatase MutT [Alteromonas sp. H39]|uniref:8-oxo-dGTP diphosphatase MutT n=1 Tax=Alteromonas sp. H39 TaxID=3389876 RepID=UPI0039E0E70A